MTVEYDRKDIIATSQAMAYLLRHHPEEAYLHMDGAGWVEADELIENIGHIGYALDRDKLEHIVETDSKQRYSFSDDGLYIRANQGHSVKVDVELEEAIPPEVLWHGTATRFCNSINEMGLVPMTRLYVHLSRDLVTAREVGARHGEVAVYEVAAGQMSDDGYVFYISVNGVWLCDAVPPEYLTRIE